MEEIEADRAPSLELVQAEKLAQLSAACNAAIVAGCGVELPDGSTPYTALPINADCAGYVPPRVRPVAPAVHNAAPFVYRDVDMAGAEVRTSRVAVNAVRAFFPTPHSLRANPAITKGVFQVKNLSGGNIMTNAKWTAVSKGTSDLSRCG